MMQRAGKMRADERAWRGQRVEQPRARAVAAPVPLKDRTGFWLAVCIAIAFVFALLH